MSSGKLFDIAQAASPVTAAGAEAAISPKKPGETLVVVHFGMTATLNGLAMELAVRELFAGKRNWRFVFVRSARAFTPAVIGNADLFMVCRNGDPDPMDLFAGSGAVSDRIVPGASPWTDENTGAVIENVRDRGMGLIALNQTIFAGHREFVDFLGVKEIGPHGYEPLWVWKPNAGHPVTAETKKFLIPRELQYAVVIRNSRAATLFETTAVHEKRRAVGGWALDAGNGRITGLLPGGMAATFRVPGFRNILWRAAHWAAKREMVEYPGPFNSFYNEP